MTDHTGADLFGRLRHDMSDAEIKAELLHFRLMNMEDLGPGIGSPDDFVRFCREQLFKDKQ